MNILVFDTCFNKSYIVLKSNDKIVSNKIIESTEENYHSAYIIPEIRNILRDNNIKVKDIDYIGVNIGPASFTGIRVGITIARVLAQQFNIKIIGVNSLEILSKLNNTNAETIVVTDARKNKVYFSHSINSKEMSEPELVEKENLLSNLKKDCFIISDKSISSYLKEHGYEAMNYEESDNNYGLYLMDIVETKTNSNIDFNWAKLKPLYIQPPSISKPKQKCI